jgi:hypothetical protein
MGKYVNGVWVPDYPGQLPPILGQTKAPQKIATSRDYIGTTSRDYLSSMSGASVGATPTPTPNPTTVSFFDPYAASADALKGSQKSDYQENLKFAQAAFAAGDFGSTMSWDKLSGGGGGTGGTGGGTGGTGGGGGTGGTGGGTGGLGSTILQGAESMNWLGMFEALRAAGIDAAEATRIAQDTAAEKTYASQIQQAQIAARQNQLAAQQARQQIGEQDFLQQRQLLEGAQQRGLGGSGVEQLAKTQARMGTGRNINQLVQQEMLSNEKLMNYIGTIEAERDTKLANADAQYYDSIFKLAGNDLENVKFLDSRDYRERTFAWQVQNAAEITANNNLNTRLDLIRIMESSDLSDAGKKAVAALMLDGGKINEQEANDLLTQYLGAAAGDKITAGKYDWTAAIVTGALTAVGVTAATVLTGGSIWAAIAPALAIGGTAGGLGGLWQSLTDKIDFTLSDGGEWKGTRAQAIDKNNPNSVVTREFGTKQGFNDIEYTLDGTKIVYVFNGTKYNKFNDAQAAWLRTQG